MPSDVLSPAAMLNFVPLTEAVTQVMTELPKPLPPVFYNQKKQVLGNKFRRFLFRGTRQTARTQIYGSPPRAVPQTALARQDAVMIHSIEMISAGNEILELMHRYNDYTVVMNAEEELDRRGRDFGVRSENLRSTAIHSGLAFGKIWFDVNGEIQMSSSGADVTIDYGIPNANFVTSSIDWSDPTANITGYLSGFITDSTRNGYGRKPKYAICGRNIVGYLSRNTSFTNYLARNQNFRDQFVNNNTIADGVMDLIWIQAQDAYFERSDGTLVGIFPDDQITFFPEPTRDVYELKEGSQPVPRQFMTASTAVEDFGSLIGQLMSNPVYGIFRYGYGVAIPVPQVSLVQGDNFLPDFPTPQAIWILDTKP